MKKNVNGQPETASQVQAAQPLPPADVVKVCLFALVLLLAMTVTTSRMTMVLTALALVCSVLGAGPVRRMRGHLSVPVLGFLAFGLMNGLAAIYSAFDEYAVSEFYKFLAAFAVVFILLSQFEKKHLRALLWAFAAVCGFIALLCVDAAGAAHLFHGYEALVEMLGGTFAGVTQTSHRVNGIYNDANVSAAILGISAVVSLYLAATSEKLRDRALACFLLGLSAQSFFLALSRGAILCFGLTLLVWLLVAPRGDKLRLFLMMFFSAAVTVALSFPAMSALDGQSMLPTLLTLATGLGIFVLDLAVGAPLARALEGRGKLVAAVIAVLVAVSAVYVAAALNFHAPYTLAPGEYLTRTVDLAPGEYTLSGDWDGQPTGLVYVQTEMDRVNSTSTTVYHGPLDQAAFTIPEGESVTTTVRLNYDEGAGTIRSLTVSDGTQVPLDYPLLPAFVAVRLQDSLLSSISFTLRVQYMVDAVAIFLRSPILGSGLGSTQGLYSAVQPYYYESLYVHDHILQVMADMGLLGLAAFLAFMGGALWLLARALRSGGDSLAAMLVACWVMMNSHSLMEINFSIRAFQCAAFVVVMLAAMAYARPVSKKAAKTLGWAVAGGFWAYGLVFGGLMMSHRAVEREADALDTDDAYAFMGALQSFVDRDVFVQEANKLNYVSNAAALDMAAFNGVAEKYVQQLREAGTYSACSGLSRYYYLPRGEFEELFACSRQGIAQVASNKDAWNLQLDFYRGQVLMAVGPDSVDVFLDGVLALDDYLDQYSQGRVEQIALTPENQAFLDRAAQVKEEGLPADEAYVALLLQPEQEQ